AVQLVDAFHDEILAFRAQVDLLGFLGGVELIGPFLLLLVPFLEEGLVTVEPELDAPFGDRLLLAEEDGRFDGPFALEFVLVRLRRVAAPAGRPEHQRRRRQPQHQSFHDVAPGRKVLPDARSDYTFPVGNSFMGTCSHYTPEGTAGKAIRGASR